jgi:NAD(P)H-dependent flavin oxidoreductase YrpB (nitropropane dioxygenase family)
VTTNRQRRARARQRREERVTGFDDPMHDEHVRSALAALADPPPTEQEPAMPAPVANDLWSQFRALQQEVAELRDRVDMLVEQRSPTSPSELDEVIMSVMDRLPLGIHVTPAAIAASASQDVKAVGSRMVVLANQHLISRHEQAGHRPTYSRKG